MMKIIQRLHRNEQGNIGILLLMTIWALVALVAMVWNTGEYGTRRQQIQNAADTAAHSAIQWQSRTMNLVTASNLLMAENASAESLWRSVKPTRDDIEKRLNAEKAAATRLLYGTTQGTPEGNVPDTEFFEELLGGGAWAGRARGTTLIVQCQALQTAVTAQMRLLTAAQQDQMNKALAENLQGLTWLQNTWVDGAQPLDGLMLPIQVAGGGSGVKAIIIPWVENEEKPRLQLILNTLPAEWPFWDQFVAQTDPAMVSTDPIIFQQRRSAIFAYQQQLRGLTPGAAEQQRQALADFYHVKLTHAIPTGNFTTDADGNPILADGPAAINAPLENAGDVPSWQDHFDTIRARYPDLAQKRFGTSSATIPDIDPINVNMDNDVIWHPGTEVDVPPPDTSIAGQPFTHNFWIFGGEYGQLPCVPMSRQICDRVGRDEQGLRPPLQALDAVRLAMRPYIWGTQSGQVWVPPPPLQPPGAQAGALWYDVTPYQPYFPHEHNYQLPPASPPPVTRPPTPEAARDPLFKLPPIGVPTFPLVDGTGRPLQGAVLATVTALNTQIQAFNKAVIQYSSDMYSLKGRVDSAWHQLGWLCWSASEPFADATWLHWVDYYRYQVLVQMGKTKDMMVLKTYLMRPIPDWAKPGMWNSAQQFSYHAAYGYNYWWVHETIRGQALGMLLSQYQQPVNDGVWAQCNAQANTFADGLAPGVTDRGATLISHEVADEWITRPWPYEVAPPEQAVPPVLGLPVDERKQYYTMMAGAVSTDTNGVRITLPRVFRTATTQPMMAYAQSETFNWMEFNGSYGAGDKFDQVSYFGGDIAGLGVWPGPWNGAISWLDGTWFWHGAVGGSPAPWRISTIGGWNYQPRLSVSDTLVQEYQNNRELQQFFQEGGVSGFDANNIDPLIMH